MIKTIEIEIPYSDACRSQEEKARITFGDTTIIISHTYLHGLTTMLKSHRLVTEYWSDEDNKFVEALDEIEKQMWNNFHKRTGISRKDLA